MKYRKARIIIIISMGLVLSSCQDKKVVEQELVEEEPNLSDFSEKYDARILDETQFYEGFSFQHNETYGESKVALKIFINDIYKNDSNYYLIGGINSGYDELFIHFRLKGINPHSIDYTDAFAIVDKPHFKKFPIYFASEIETDYEIYEDSEGYEHVMKYPISIMMPYLSDYVLMTGNLIKIESVK